MAVWHRPFHSPSSIISPRLALSQILWRKKQAFNWPPACDSFNDFRQICQGDATIEQVIGLDQNTHPAGALIQATRGARASSQFGQSTRRQLFLQGQANLLRALFAHDPFFMIRVPAVGADKEIALS